MSEEAVAAAWSEYLGVELTTENIEDLWELRSVVSQRESSKAIYDRHEANYQDLVSGGPGRKLIVHGPPYDTHWWRFPAMHTDQEPQDKNKNCPCSTEPVFGGRLEEAFEPRSWPSLKEIPEGVLVRDATWHVWTPDEIKEEVDQGWHLHDAGPFTEVRSWASLQDIPEGVAVRDIDGAYMSPDYIKSLGSDGYEGGFAPYIETPIRYEGRYEPSA